MLCTFDSLFVRCNRGTLDANIVFHDRVSTLCRHCEEENMPNDRYHSN